MPNLYRGEVPFKAAGIEAFVCLLNSDLAAAYAEIARTAPAYARPSPFQPDTVEETAVPAWIDEDRGIQKVDAEGQPVFRLERRLVNHAERQRRWIAAMEATITRPDPEASLILFRAGLRQWERESQRKIDDGKFREIVDALGLAEVRGLLLSALTFGVYLRGAEGAEEEDQESRGKAHAVSASST